MTVAIERIDEALRGDRREGDSFLTCDVIGEQAAKSEGGEELELGQTVTAWAARESGVVRAGFQLISPSMFATEVKLTIYALSVNA